MDNASGGCANWTLLFSLDLTLGIISLSLVWILATSWLSFLFTTVSVPAASPSFSLSSLALSPSLWTASDRSDESLAGEALFREFRRLNRALSLVLGRGCSGALGDTRLGSNSAEEDSDSLLLEPPPPPSSPDSLLFKASMTSAFCRRHSRTCSMNHCISIFLPHASQVTNPSLEAGVPGVADAADVGERPT